MLVQFKGNSSGLLEGQIGIVVGYERFKPSGKAAKLGRKKEYSKQRTAVYFPNLNSSIFPDRIAYCYQGELEPLNPTEGMSCLQW